VTARGLVWSTAEYPTLETNDGYTDDGSGTGSFVSDISGFKANTEYYVRAYATNSAGTGYGNQVNFVSANDSIYAVSLDRSNEDYVNFGSFANFTAGSDWSIIEKIKMPEGTGDQIGWHFFRGKAWEDLNGDIAIRISASEVVTWTYYSGWNSLSYNGTFHEEQWYTICLQYDSAAETLELYVDGVLVDHMGLLPLDDSSNDNNMFWGGQDAAPDQGVGDLYSERSIIIAHQAWLQRTLTPSEIANYDGYIASEPALFFATEITSDSVLDISGNECHGVNGNSPEYIKDLP